MWFTIEATEAQEDTLRQVFRDGIAYRMAKFGDRAGCAECAGYPQPCGEHQGHRDGAQLYRRLADVLGLDLHAGPQDDPASVPSRSAAGRYAEVFRAMCENGIDEYAAGITGETDEYLRLNRAMAAAKAQLGVPWWRRWLIERRILRELDYFKRTGGNG